MEKKINDSEVADWVDQKIASLPPVSQWSPNADTAYRRLTKLREAREQGAGFQSFGRLAMALTITTFIAIVLMIIPWKWLRTSMKEAHPPELQHPLDLKPSAPPIQPETVITTSNPSEAPALIQTPVPSPSPTPPSSSESKSAASQETKEESKGASSPKCNKVQSVYTDEARRAHIQGEVILEVTIHSDGTISVERVVSGLGYGLDESAIAAVQNWMCTPATIDGKPVNVTVRMSVNFRLY